MNKSLTRHLSRLLIALILFSYVPTSLATSSYSDAESMFDEKYSVSNTNLIFPNDTSEVNWTGAFSYAYPIEIAPGRSNFQPDLTLLYNNQSTNNENIFGYGWSLELPNISRFNKTGVDHLYDELYFQSTYDGELVEVNTDSSGYGDYGAKVEKGNFFVYEYDSSGYWTATDKSGSIYTFGSSADSQVVDPSDSSRIYSWYIEEIRDVNDNYITFNYSKDGSQIYPDTITYTGNGTTEGIFTIEFTLETKSDGVSSYKRGFEVNTDYRISKIKVKKSGTLLRRYDFAYITGDNGKRSLLESISKLGRASDGTISTLPEITFSYQSSTPSYTQELSESTPYYFVTDAGLPKYTYDEAGRLLDLNADALPDFIYSFQTSGSVTSSEVAINDGDGSGWTPDSGYSIPVGILDTNIGGDYGVRFADLNGDGYVDIARGVGGISGVGNGIYINNADGSGWSLDSSYVLPMTFVTRTTSSSTEDDGIRLFDVNGDGFADLVLSIEVSGTVTSSAVYINDGDGTGWTYASSYSVPVGFTDPGAGEYGVRISDVNGDGLLDLVRGVGGISGIGNGVYINTGDGTGWTLDSSYNVPMTFVTDSGLTHDDGVRLFDVNGDGLDDFVWSIETGGTVVNEYVSINDGDGTGWTDDTSYSFPVGFIETGIAGDYGVRTGDFDGDGLDDLVKSVGGISGLGNGVYLKDGNIPDLLSGIEYPNGGSSTISYSTSVEQDSGFPFQMILVDEILTDDGQGWTSTVSYDFSNPGYYYNDEYDRGFAAFETITKTEEDRVTETTYYQADEDPALIGMVKEQKVYDTSSNLYKHVINDWDYTDLGYDNDFVYLSETVSLDYDGDSSHKDKAVAFTYDTDNGNLLSKTEYGEVTATSSGSYTDVTNANEKRTTTLSYASDSSGVIQNKVYQETLTDGSASTVSQKRYYYDSLSLGSVSTGNMTKQSVWLESSSWLDTLYSYDSYGNVVSITDPNGNTTNFTYDSYNLYPDTVEDALSNTIEYSYDYSTGQVTEEINVNGGSTTYTYDGFGRLLTKSVPNPNSTGSTELISTTYYDSTPPVHSVTEMTVGSVTTSSRIYYDGLGRPMQEWKASESAYPIVIDTWYDAEGNVESQTLPYSSSSYSYVGRDSSQETVDFSVDPLGRISTQTSPLGTLTHNFDDWSDTVTNQNAVDKTLFYDAYGRLIQVDEENGSSTYTTNYYYNELDQLTQLIDAQGNERNFTYDTLGHVLSQEDLHDPYDTNFGTWTYSYDSNGNRLSQEDPSAQTISWEYDELNRVTQEDWNDDSSADITYGYDTATNGVGLVDTITTDAVTTEYTYDYAQNVASETKTIDSIAYTTNFTYDLLGRLTDIEYPDSAMDIAYTYNSTGLLETVTKDTSETILNDIDYSPLQQVAYLEYGNGSSTTNTYEASNEYRLSSKVTTGYLDENLVSDADLYSTIDSINAETSAVTFTVGNQGTTDVDYTLGGINSLYLDAENIRSKIWDASSSFLLAGNFSSKTIYLYVSSLFASLTADEYYTVEYCVDSAGVAYETDTSNNCYESGFTFTGDLPDLKAEITSMDTDTYVLTYELSNIGTMDVVDSINGTRYTIRLDGDIVEETTWSSDTDASSYLPASSSFEKTFTIDTSSLVDGYGYIIDVCIDSGNKIEGESDETNNCDSTSFTYTEPTAFNFMNWLIPTAHASTVSGNIQDLTYTYDGVGNITEITDNSITPTEKTVTYTYDDLNRLSTATSSGLSAGDYSLSYSYDEVGNMTYKSDVGTMVYGGTGSPTPHAVTSVAGVSYSYDDNGNLSSDGTSTYSWTIRNKLEGSSDMSYTYDQNGQRVSSTNSSTGDETIYVNKYLEVRNGSPLYYIWADDIRVASFDGTDISFFHQDHLGGTAVSTDDTATTVNIDDYYPYGSSLLSYSGSSELHHSFSDKEFDDDLSLYYFEARWYDSNIGKFSSLDPAQYDGRVFKMLQDPQSFNAYAYARNNPVAMIDPDGEYFETAIDLIFLALSARDYYLDPGLSTGIWVGLDAIGVALPLPALAGYIKNGPRAVKILKYFTETAGRAGKSLDNIASTFVKNAFFKQSRRAWSQGTSGDSLANLVGHFEMHGTEVAATSVEDYYNIANDFLDSGNYKTWSHGGSKVNYNIDTNVAVYTDKNGNIQSMYTITNENKRSEYEKIYSSLD